MGTVTSIYGDGGTGKSLLALQLAASVVLGRLWLNRVPMTGRVIYLSAEDDRAELHRRLAAIAALHNVAMADLAGVTIADLAGRDALLANMNVRKGTLNSTKLFELIDAKMREIAPSLLVVDTLADAYPGNENDRAMVRQFVGMMRGLAIRHRCAVVLLAHPSLTGIATGAGASGSTAWNNSVRSRLYLERIKDGDHEPNPDARRLKVMKSNYGRIGTEITVAWKDGVFIAQQDGGTLETTTKADRVFIKLLQQFHSEGRRVNAVSGSNYAPTVFSHHTGAESCTKSALRDAMNRLLETKKIAIITGRENSKDVNYLAIT